VTNRLMPATFIVTLTRDRDSTVILG